jgi:hypothetical protein
MNKWLRYLLVSIAIIAIGITISVWILNEDIPESIENKEADDMAISMMNAVNKSAWDTTRYIQWTFPGPHEYLWDKQRNFVLVKWNDYKVLLNTKTRKGLFWDLSSTNAHWIQDQKKVDKAWSFFCNDSWWLNAPVKAMDPGVEPSVVKLDDGRKGLKLEYKSGGVTPGDSYVWLLDDQNRPTSYKMWVSIIPVGGVEFTWENWITLSTGAKIATIHKGPAFTLELTDISSDQSLESLGMSQDPFSPLEKDQL